MMFETTYRDHYAAIYRFCHRLTGCAEEARDMTQETFMRFYYAVQRHDKIDHPTAWLYRVAGNLCISGLRQGRRRAEILRHQPSEAAGGSDPEQELAQRETMLRIRDAVQRLSVRDQVLLNLYMDRRPYAEMAEVVGVRRGSVGTLLSRALAQLRSPEITGVKM